MQQPSELPLQQAVYELLSQDSDLAALTSGVYDNPPPDASYSYITFGQTRSVDWSTKTTSGIQSLLILHIYSQVSRKEVLLICDKIAEILQPGAINIPNQNLVVMHFEQNDIILEDDGITFHGVLRYRVFIESLAA